MVQRNASTPRMARRAVVLGLPLCIAAPWSAAANAWRESELTFPSADGTLLAGSVVTPRETNAVAGVVLVHGAGQTKRNTALASWMALHGIVVMTYDKRGVGLSGGVYEDADNVSAANLRLLATDASAALNSLAADPRWRRLPRGYVGYSQAGWVIPLALAAGAPGPDFIAFWSGPTCTTSEQLHFQRFSETRGYDFSRFTQKDVDEAMKAVRYREDDVDPLKHLANVTVPALWLFGGRDIYVPVTFSTRRLQALIDGGKSSFSYRVFQDDGHDLAASSRQESFVAMVDWVKARAGASRR